MMGGRLIETLYDRLAAIAGYQAWLEIEILSCGEFSRLLEYK